MWFCLWMNRIGRKKERSLYREKTKLLVIDDEAAICDVLSASLKDEGYEVHTANNGVRGLRAISELKPDVVLLDIWMPGRLDGLDVLKRAKSLTPTQFIIMSGHGNIETAVKAIQQGAWDFLEKPLSMDKIFVLIRNILRYQAEKEQKKALLHRLRKSFAIVGTSQKMVLLKKMISRVAPTSSWVLITGEKGVGKELVAHNIHYLSLRASHPFVRVDSSVTSRELMESELFGYEDGFFPGRGGSRGKVEHADGGTLFINEICDVSLDVQDKILVFLQDKTFQRVGGNETLEVDVRILAATSRDVKEEISQGHLREDLYYRLTTFPLYVPPLRDRKSDIPVLISYFGESFMREGGDKKKTFSKKALDIIGGYSWPGNIRELKNFVERVYIIHSEEFMEAKHLSQISYDFP